MPGVYALDFTLQVSASHNVSAPGTASFVFEVVPEPSTGLLVIAGVLAIMVTQCGWHNRVA